MNVKNIEDFTEVFRTVMCLRGHIDVEKLIRDLKGEVVNHNKPYAEVFKIDNNDDISFSIALPTISDTYERRYLITHLIGHLLIHMNYLIDNEKWQNIESYSDSAYYRQGHNIENYEADEFAMTLLMNKEEFLKISKENMDNGIYKIDDIAKHFEVPTKYVIARGRQLGLFSLM